jgi:hypothetical protein
VLCRPALSGCWKGALEGLIVDPPNGNVGVIESPGEVTPIDPGDSDEAGDWILNISLRTLPDIPVECGVGAEFGG